MPIKASGVLTKEHLEKLQAAIKFENGDTEAARWANLGWIAIKTELGLKTKDEAVVILIEINTQLIQTEKATYLKEPGLWGQRDCPDKALLISMLNSNRPRILNFIDPKGFNLSKLKEEYGEKNLQAMCDVVNWCRELVNGENGRIKIEGNVTFGGTYAPQDLHTTEEPASASKVQMPPAHAAAMRRVANMPKPKAPTPPTPPKRPTPPSSATDSSTSTSGDLVGRIHAEDGVIITIGGKPYDSKNSAHRKLAEQNGYNPNTGVEI